MDIETTALSQLMRDKLRLRGQSFGALLARARHRMPRRVYRAALRLAEAETLAQNARLRLTLDHDGLAGAHRQVEAFLADIDPADERKGRLLGILASLAVNLLVLFALLMAFLMWRGFL